MSIQSMYFQNIIRALVSHVLNAGWLDFGFLSILANDFYVLLIGIYSLGVLMLLGLNHVKFIDCFQKIHREEPSCFIFNLMKAFPIRRNC